MKAHRLVLLSIIGFSLLARQPATHAGFDDAASVAPPAPAYERRELEGWTVQVRRALIETSSSATVHALELLRQQLEEIVRVVPEPALKELRRVPLYFSPEYPGSQPTAEYHPDVGWLKANGRDPAMAQAIEFTNLRQFEAEMDRMPNFALHELAHAYHHRVLPTGFGNPEIKAAYERAKASGKYDRVERRSGRDKPNTFERAYAMTDPMEYFAESSEAYFSRNDFYPFTRDELKAHDPEMFALLGKLWEAEPGVEIHSGSEKTPVTARPGGLMADSPVTFPKQGALPAKYPPDVKVQDEPAEKDYYIFSSPCRSLKQIAAIQKAMPSGQFTPPPADWKHLPRTRRILTEGGELRLLALGDSIVNDTMRSGWVAQLQEAFPKARIQTTVYVRGGGGCQHYRKEDRVAKYILPRKPDLVFIGGISQRDMESIREVIRQLRAGLPEVEILLATGTFGTVDPRDAVALAQASHSGTGEYGRVLKSLAAEQHCAYLDMTTPWAEYLRSAKVHPHLFYRDAVHANEFGEQVLAKIMTAFWTTPGASSSNSDPSLLPLRVSDNNRFLATTDGKPFFWLGDTAWELFHRLDRAEAEFYLRDRAAKGFNVIQAVALSELDGLTEPNRRGHLPLLDKNPALPDVKDGPDNDYWDFVDEVLDLAATNGLYVGFLPTWGSHVTSSAFDGKVNGVFNTANALIYGRFLGERYRNRSNLIWILGGDKAPSTPEAVTIWRAMARGIVLGLTGREDYDAVLMTYHTSGPGHVSDFLHDEPWLDFTSAQSSHGNFVESWRFIEKHWHRQPIKPVIDLESSYPDALIPAAWLPTHMRAAHPSTKPSNDDHARRAAYWAVFAGAFGHTYGHNSIWQMYAPPRKPVLDARLTWREALDAPSAKQMGYLRGLMESRPMLDRVPDQSLFVDGAGEGAAQRRATRGRDYAFIYSPDGVPFTVRLGGFAGEKILATWFNPRTSAVEAIGEFPNAGERAFTPPQPGEPLDWVLVLDDAAKNVPVPGRPRN